MPEDGFESNLNLFFDSTADDNLPIESIYALGTGLVRMFEKISLRHGLKGLHPYNFQEHNHRTLFEKIKSLG